LDGLKAQWISQVNQTAYSLLVQTDWMVVRKAETNVDVPTETLTYRAAVRTAVVTNRTAIINASDVPALVTIITNMSWPSGA
jgi:hypothetical protein